MSVLLLADDEDPVGPFLYLSDCLKLFTFATFIGASDWPRILSRYQQWTLVRSERFNSWSIFQWEWKKIKLFLTSTHSIIKHFIIVKRSRISGNGSNNQQLILLLWCCYGSMNSKQHLIIKCNWVMW